jgi:hypothetical protein
MVFKVKQRAKTSYFKKVVTRNFGINADIDNASGTTVDQFGNTTDVQYNWPYDFFSLVELASIDATVEFSNRDFTDWDGETLPPIDGVSATEENIDLSTGYVAEMIPESPIGVPMEDAEDIADQYQETQAVIASAGKALVAGSQLKDQVMKDTTTAAELEISGELSLLREQDNLFGWNVGVNTSTYLDFLNTTGASQVLDQRGSWGIPTDQVLDDLVNINNYATDAGSQAAVVQLQNMQGLYNNYNNAVQIYGANSTQASAAAVQLNNAVTQFTNINTTNFFGTNR